MSALFEAEREILEIEDLASSLVEGNVDEVDIAAVDIFFILKLWWRMSFGDC